MPRTLVLVFHRDLARSRANAALARAAGELAAVDVVDMQTLYRDDTIDGEREAARLISADHIVLQFPLQWYATPALLKAWQDAVLTRMFYVFCEQEGRQVEGKPLLVATTAGNVEESYAATGSNLYTVPELLRPLEATANRCGLVWQTPFVLFRADRIDRAELARECGTYARRIAALGISARECDAAASA